MVLAISTTLSRLSVTSLENTFLKLSLYNITQTRERHRVNTPRLRNPTWFTKKNRVIHDDRITTDNAEFLREVVQDKYPPQESVLNNNLQEQCHQDNVVDKNGKVRRTGVIARKIGIYPMWLSNGKKISTTLLQILDNHVIRHYTPEEYEPARKRNTRLVNKKACLLLGAEGTDPSLFTRDYCGLFKDSGVIPKKYLARFYVSPEGVMSPGTAVTINHFQVGSYVDVRGKTMDRGFQGVMTRHDFKGMPATHGHTKTHRRGGNIGGGGEKARVWPGTRMPGHMGNHYRILRGLRILRVNTKYQVMWVMGQAIPGETNGVVTVYDTVLPLRQEGQVPVPTWSGAVGEEEVYGEGVHEFGEKTITFVE